MKSLFFNSIDGDRKYNANDFTRYFSSILSNGVFLNGSNNFKVSAENGMNIIINKGYGNINGNLFFEDSQTRMARTILASDATGMKDTPWVLADNSIQKVTVEELKEALTKAGAKQTELWIKPYQTEKQ